MSETKKQKYLKWLSIASLVCMVCVSLPIAFWALTITREMWVFVATGLAFTPLLGFIAWTATMKYIKDFEKQKRKENDNATD